MDATLIDPDPEATVDRDLLLAGQAGDHQALDRFLARHMDIAWRLARRALGNGADADDALQEAFIAAAAGAARYRGDGGARAWLLRTVLNACAMHRRREGRRRDALARLPPPPPALEPTMDHDLVQTELAALSETDRHAVLLRFAEGLPLREVAAILAVPEKTAESRAARAMARLRERLRRRGMAVPTAGLAAALGTASAAEAPAAFAVALRAAVLAAGTGPAAAGGSSLWLGLGAVAAAMAASMLVVWVLHGADPTLPSEGPGFGAALSPWSETAPSPATAAPLAPRDPPGAGSAPLTMMVPLAFEPVVIDRDLAMPAVTAQVSVHMVDPRILHTHGIQDHGIPQAMTRAQVAELMAAASKSGDAPGYLPGLTLLPGQRGRVAVQDQQALPGTVGQRLLSTGFTVDITAADDDDPHRAVSGLTAVMTSPVDPTAIGGATVAVRVWRRIGAGDLPAVRPEEFLVVPIRPERGVVSWLDGTEHLEIGGPDGEDQSSLLMVISTSRALVPIFRDPG
jgi:RNA polymerase sigma-70 factor (ECF subfamily)